MRQAVRGNRLFHFPLPTSHFPLPAFRLPPSAFRFPLPASRLPQILTAVMPATISDASVPASADAMRTHVTSFSGCGFVHVMP